MSICLSELLDSLKALDDETIVRLFSSSRAKSEFDCPLKLSSDAVPESLSCHYLPEELHIAKEVMMTAYGNPYREDLADAPFDFRIDLSVEGHLEMMLYPEGRKHMLGDLSALRTLPLTWPIESIQEIECANEFGKSKHARIMHEVTDACLITFSDRLQLIGDEHRLIILRGASRAGMLYDDLMMVRRNDYGHVSLLVL